MELREITKEYLERNHLSGVFLANHIGTCKDTIWKWINGDKGLSPRNTEKVKKFLDGDWYVSAAQIIKEHEEKERNEGENEDVKHYTNWRDYNYR